MLRRLPVFGGEPLEVAFRPGLRVHGGVLRLSGDDGYEVHAASSIRERWILLDTGLKGNPEELARVLAHEIFHFVWVRLSNAERWSYEEVLGREFDGGARGELGWSAEVRRLGLRAGDREKRSRRWREYVCESFCDTVAWWLTGRTASAERTLAVSRQRSREHWLRNFFGSGRRIAL